MARVNALRGIGTLICILAGMEWAGIVLDAGANCAFGTEARLSSPNSQVEMWVIPVDEAQILAREALAVIVARRLQEGGR